MVVCRVSFGPAKLLVIILYKSIIIESPTPATQSTLVDSIRGFPASVFPQQPRSVNFCLTEVYTYIYIYICIYLNAVLPHPPGPIANTSLLRC